MNRAVKVQGIECPIIREGDNVVDIVTESVLKKITIKGKDISSPIIEINSYIGLPVKDEYERLYDSIDTYSIDNKDIIGITESVVARAAGQYITIDDIAADIDKKFGKGATIALINPIYSRNRFSLILKGIARSASKVIIVMPEYDEVSNPRGINPFTQVNIEEYYKELCRDENCECDIDYYTERDAWIDSLEIDSIDCRLHNAKHYSTPSYTMYTLADICSDKSPDWGVLGTNKVTEEKLKLFPSKAEAQRVCDEVKAKIKEKTGKDVIVCIYGDGCFKDPVGGIWEFADPVTMPAYTDKELIESTPCELKLKNMIDTLGSDAEIEVTLNTDKSKWKDGGKMGTTPRIYRDLLASLMDLTSGSGDRATPVVLIQNYF